MSVKQTYSFPDILLPADKIVDLSKSAEASKLFNTVAGLYQVAIQALESLKKEDLPSFDSLATDCSCHLRALRIAVITQELFSSYALGKQLDELLENLKTKKALLTNVEADLKDWCAKGKKMSGSLTPIVSAIQALQGLEISSYQFTLQDTLDKLQVKLNLTEELAYVIHAHILAIVKSYEQIDVDHGTNCADQACGKILKSKHQIYKEVTQVKQLTQCVQNGNLNVNNKLIEKDIYQIAKQQLTDLSVQFLLKEAQKIEQPHIYNFLYLNQKKFKGKVEIPDYYSLTAAFQVCLERKIPLLLKIKRCLHAHRYQELKTPFDVVIYLFPQKGKGFQPSYPALDQLKGPVIIVEGKRSGKTVKKEPTEEYIKRLMQNFDFLHFCQLDGSQHKQYTSDEDSLQQKPSEVIPLLQKKEYMIEAKKVDSLKQEAEKLGCSFYNQSLLILSHIFVDSFKNQKQEFELLKQTAKWIGLESKNERKDGE